jgi:hypothetical protein
MMYGNHMGGGGWAVSILVTVIIVGLIAATFVWLASGDGATRQRRPVQPVRFSIGVWLAARSPPSSTKSCARRSAPRRAISSHQALSARLAELGPSYLSVPRSDARPH